MLSFKTTNAFVLKKAHARRIWLRAQMLDSFAPFGNGPDATRAAVEHLGYVQIDTINVIERCHHHILFTRIPGYQRAHLRRAQSEDKSVFEYRAHALAYLPTKDFRFSSRAMNEHWKSRNALTPAKKIELRNVLARIRKHGALTIRDIDDDVLVDKDHAWASRKPSERALRFAFYGGRITVSERRGILKTYELTDRHFGWTTPPRSAPEKEILNYRLDRALRSQGIVSLDSICFHDARRKAAMLGLIESRIRRNELLRVEIQEVGTNEHWMSPEAFETAADPAEAPVHILSPFDPLIIQRKRLQCFFGYEHRFEAYVPKAQRRFGYFALPILVGDEIVAAIDLKTDRSRGKLLLQQWTWKVKDSRKVHKKSIEEALDRFERFQLAA